MVVGRSIGVATTSTYGRWYSCVVVKLGTIVASIVFSTWHHDCSTTTSKS